LLAGKKWSSFSAMTQWRQFGDINFIDHVVLWARMDFLMSMGKEKFKSFMFEIKGRHDQDTGKALTTDLVGIVRGALKKSYGLNPISFDVKFREWVKANYPAK